MLFLFSLLAPAFIIEGCGIALDRTILTLYYCLIPLFLAVKVLMQKKVKLFVSPVILLFILIFFLLQFVSLYFSIDLQQSFEKIIWYFVLASIYLYCSTINEIETNEKTTKIILVFIAFFAICSLFVPFIRNSFLSPYINFRETQVLTATHSSHNHLGDLLGLALIFILLLYQKERKKLYLVFLFCLVPFFLLSFSRSSYIALMVCALTYAFFMKPQFKTMLGILSLSWILFFFVILVSSKTPYNNIPFIANIQNVLTKKLYLAPRTLLESRYFYIQESIQAIKERPLTGFGAGNFYFISNKYNTSSYFSGTSHNIILDKFAENGIAGGLVFALGLCLILFSAFYSRQFFSLPLLYLAINFQTDYTFTIYVFMVIFVILASCSSAQKEQPIKLPALLFFFTCAITSCFVIIYLASSIALSVHDFDTALLFYPLNKQALYEKINSDIPYSFDIENAIATYDYIAPYDLDFLVPSARYYERRKNLKKALYYYARAYETNRFINFEIIKKIYLLKVKYEKIPSANRFLGRVFVDYKNIYKSRDFIEEINTFCATLKPKNTCRKLRWWGK